MRNGVSPTDVGITKPDNGLTISGENLMAVVGPTGDVENGRYSCH